jgi:flagellar protein FliO/FliZ
MQSLRSALSLPLALAAALAAAPAGAQAQVPSTAAAPPAGAPELGASLLQMMFGLAVVIALLFGCLWVIRRLGAPRGGGAAIKVLGAAAVGPRERVVLVGIGDDVLVLGVAPGSVSKLHEIKRAELPLAADTPGPAAPGGKAFAAWLRQATERRDAQ